MTTEHLEKKLEPIIDRDPKYLETDKSAVRAIAQAAIDVELFTIPLYMVALYSIKGMHQINSKNIDYYQGRLWPGSAPTANPKKANEKAFNIIYSLFMEEMLHLQMAANLAKALNVQPCFTNSFLQNEKHGWTCYGNEETVIPHIIDLQDTKNDSDVKVKLDSLNKEHIKLFLAIEQDEKEARKNIDEKKVKDYFPEVPFKNWTPEKTAIDLPMFGTIGWLYECYACYLSIEYSNGKTLWKEVYGILQRDMFNYMQKSHPEKEFPGFEPAIGQKRTSAEFDEAIDMMIAITDRGEGSTLQYSVKPKKGMLKTLCSLFRFLGGGRRNNDFTIALSRWKNNPPPRQAIKQVKEKYRPSKTALEEDYPAYTDTGAPTASSNAQARYSNSAVSHYDNFKELQKLLGNVVTWDVWHQKRKNVWTAKMLKTKNYNSATAGDRIPTPDDVAGALNRLKQNDPDGKNYELLSRAATGAIAGITTVLNDYWQDPTVDFPYPSMVGAGDRISMAWAIFGKAPDLSLDLGTQDPSKLYHACQGLDIEDPDNKGEAPVEVFHSCRGSNECKAQGGCGFAQLDRGGGSCSAMRVTQPTIVKGREVLSDEDSESAYSAPADNKCRGFGGCAVPISASQLFPNSGEMKIYNFVGDKQEPEKIGSMSFQLGDSVYDKAWDAYSEVLKARGQEPGEKPEPSDLRLALPPSI